MARMCSGTPHPGCPVEASPAPGVFVDSRRESKDRIGKLLKTKEASAKKSDKRVKERANY